MPIQHIATEPGPKVIGTVYPPNFPAHAKVTISWEGIVFSDEHPNDPTSVEIIVLVNSPQAKKPCDWKANESCGAHHKPSGAWTNLHVEQEATTGPKGELEVTLSLNFVAVVHHNAPATKTQS
jgi:hypothetical protein